MIIENDSAKLPHDVSFFSLGGVGEGEEHEGALPCLFDGGHKGSSHRVALHHPLSRQEVDPTLLVGLDGRQRQVHGAGGLIAVDVLGEHLVDGSCPVGFRTVRQAQDAETSEVFCPVGGYPQESLSTSCWHAWPRALSSGRQTASVSSPPSWDGGCAGGRRSSLAPQRPEGRAGSVPNPSRRLR